MSALPKEIMDQLQKEYVESFKDKAAILKVSLASKDYKGLENVFHKLAGSGKTYFMPEISILGRAAEEYLMHHKEPELELISKATDQMLSFFESRKMGVSVIFEDSNPIIVKLKSK